MSPADGVARQAAHGAPSNTAASAGDDGHEPLPPGDYQSDASYIDNVTEASFNMLTNALEVHHADGSWIVLDYGAVAHGSVPRATTAGEGLHLTITVYYSNRANGKIYPHAFNQQTTPRLMGMVRLIEAQCGRQSAFAATSALLAAS